MSIIQDVRDTFSRRDNALNQLIVLNVVVFAVIVLLYAIAFLSNTSEWFKWIMSRLELSPNLLIVLRRPWTVLTYAFVHQDPFHILFNMLNLYWFGQLLREYLGDRRLVSIYILGGLAGAAVFLLAYNLLPTLAHNAPTIGVIGASAAVIAVIVAAATLLPDYTFVMLLFGPVKIKWIATALVLISFALINRGNTGGEITHLGGALLGFVFIKQLKAGRDMGRPVVAIGDWFSSLGQRRPTMTVSHRTTAGRPASAAPKAGPSATPPEEVDLILEKISRSGYESLSKEEKQKLFRASQQ